LAVSSCGAMPLELDQQSGTLEASTLQRACPWLAHGVSDHSRPGHEDGGEPFHRNRSTSSPVARSRIRSTTLRTRTFLAAIRSSVPELRAKFSWASSRSARKADVGNNRRAQEYHARSRREEANRKDKHAVVEVLTKSSQPYCSSSCGASRRRRAR